ncbi:hypothetical protein FSB73_03265 [Arachidicoccus ginsenosidivorans]|uniref:Uncharacterized protein n=1 Tax=Arachidicoccus ginsenosidivorans TaxID=496057 RepID=A0A5B8VIH9_9BACT|nr:hypothetical protein [Arachidicoccus ginsenosidivorans]QEC70841.1 hypothetical protein FSB73_03265 [Arachidicoccus ginsenosidivorans]
MNQQDLMPQIQKGNPFFMTNIKTIFNYSALNYKKLEKHPTISIHKLPLNINDIHTKSLNNLIFKTNKSI